ncbi:hypothetical protein ABZU25_33460 [Micromonospora sp. NPDC005215]|uniref:hypothetical protein n=1 Tax=Micromonospora sp. NPDC005215 TaxID=3157024 RepID=UPI0033A75BB4
MTPKNQLTGAWRAAHAPVAGVPRWARIAAYAIPFTVLPAGLWRLPVAFRDDVGLGGRRVPMLAALIPATLHATVLTVAWTTAFARIFAGVTMGGTPLPGNFPTQRGAGEAAIFYACYLPLLLWGPLLAAVAYAYRRRRRGGYDT